MNKEKKGDKILPNSLIYRVNEMLKDETRLAIHLCLLTYEKLTLKQLSRILQKGKTTIHHHMKKLEEVGIIKWEEKESDKKRLKTRLYSLNLDNLNKILYQLQEEVKSQKISDEKKGDLKGSLIELMNTDVLVTINLMKWMIKYIEHNRYLFDLQTLDNQRETFIRIIPLTTETLQIYKEFEEKMLRTLNKIKLERFNKDEIDPTTHISTIILVPIKDILEWRQKL
ncbi:MAG: ArsR/SmtB family transcription factor [Promethearchaeota archaeon]